MTDPVDVIILDRISPGVEEDELVARLRGQGVSTAWLEWDRLSFGADGCLLRVDGRPMPVPAVALVRSRIFTRAVEPIFVFDVLRMLELAGVLVVNGVEATQRAHDKVLAAHVLGLAGVPVPPTRMVTTMETAGRCLLDWQDVMFKPVHGHSTVGSARMQLEPEADAPDTPPGLTIYQEVQLWHLLRNHGALCGQRYVTHIGNDLRLLVLDNRIIACNRRRALFSAAGYGSHRGYEVERAEQSDEVLGIALRAASALGLRQAAVDIVDGDGGLAVLEVNPMVSLWRDLDARGLHLTKEGIGAAVADQVVRTVRRG